MSAPKYTLSLVQGSTAALTFRWEDALFVYKPIQAIQNTAPVRIECEGHGVPDGWRFAIQGAEGLTQLNTKDAPPEPPDESDFFYASVVDEDNIEINSINATKFPAYSGGGTLVYLAPKDLTGYTARAQIRIREPGVPAGGTLVDTFTTEDERLLTTGTGITIDVAGSAIYLEISAEDSEGYTFRSALWSLELVSPTGDVFTLAQGPVTLAQETTRA